MVVILLDWCNQLNDAELQTPKIKEIFTARTYKMRSLHQSTRCATPYHDTDFSVYTAANRFRSEYRFDCHFQSQYRMTLVRKKWPPSFFLAPRDSFLPVRLFTSRISYLENAKKSGRRKSLDDRYARQIL
jgi:hypothetical protein